jgi:hypothetical protein
MTSLRIAPAAAIGFPAAKPNERVFYQDFQDCKPEKKCVFARTFGFAKSEAISCSLVVLFSRIIGVRISFFRSLTSVGSLPHKPSLHLSQSFGDDFVADCSIGYHRLSGGEAQMNAFLRGDYVWR